MDSCYGTRSGNSVDANRRIGVLALPVGSERPACGSIQSTYRSCGKLQRRQTAVYQRPGKCNLCIENRFVCPGLRPDDGSRKGIQLEVELRRYRSDVARRMYYSIGIPERYQKCIRPKSKSSQPAARPILQRTGRGCSGRMETCLCHSFGKRNSGSGNDFCASLLRWFPQRKTSC